MDTLRFIRTEMERSWGDKKLAVFDEEEAQKWVVGVGVYRLRFFEHPRRMYNFPVTVRTGSFPL